MADIIGSFGRGFQVGEHVGERWSQRRFDKKAQDIERRYMAGELDDAALDEELRALAESTGAAKRGLRGEDGATPLHSARAGALRERRAGALDRQSAAAYVGGDFAGGHQFGGQAAALRADRAGALENRYAYRQATGYREGPGGRPDLAAQAQAGADERARAGDLDRAAQMQGGADAAARQAFNFYGGNVIRMLQAGIKDGVVNDEAMQEVEVYAQELARIINPTIGRVQYDAESNGFNLLTKDGQEVDFVPADKLQDYIVQAGDDPAALIPSILEAQRGEAAAQRESQRETLAKARDFYFDTAKNILGDVGSAQALADATAKASGAGIDVSKLEAMDDGSYLMSVGGKVYVLTPNAEGESLDGQAMKFRIQTQDGTDVSADEIGAAQQRAAIDLATSLSMANANLDIEKRMQLMAALTETYQMVTGGGGGGSMPSIGGALGGGRGQQPPGGARASDRAPTSLGQSYDDPAQAAEAALPFILGLETSAGQGDDVRNPRSSAMGRGQFLDRTWLQMISRYAPEKVEGMTEEQILQLRADPELSRQMTQAYAEENARALANGGAPLNPETLYLAHHFGPQGALRLLRAGDRAPVEQVLGAATVRANPTYRGMTVGELRDSFMRRMERVGAEVGAPVVASSGGGGPRTRGALARRGEAAAPVADASAMARRQTPRGLGAETRRHMGALFQTAATTPARLGDEALAAGGNVGRVGYDYLTGLLSGE